MSLGFKNKITIAFALSFIVVISISFWVYLTNLELVENNNLVSHSYYKSAKIDHFRLLIDHAEVLQNAFFENGKKNFLRLYEATIDSILDDIDYFKSLYVADKDHKNILDSLEDAIKLYILKSQNDINGFKSSRMKDYLAHSQLEKENALLEIKHHIDSLNKVGETRLIERLDSLNSSSRKATATFIILVIINLVVLVISYFLLMNGTKKREAAEKTLRESESKLRTIINNVPTMIFVKDKNNKYIHVNNAFSNKTTLMENELINKTVYDFFPQEIAEKMDAEDKSVIANGEPILGIEELVDTREGKKWFLVSKVPFIDENGKVSGVVGVADDITLRKQAEEKLKESEQKLRELNASKDRFFSIIAHDLRSPFSALLGYAEILNSEEQIEQDDIKSFVTTIHSLGKSILDLLENLLTWAKVQLNGIDYSPECFSISEVIDNNIKLFKLVAEKKRINLLFTNNKDVKVFADKEMTNTVVRNLISNAIKFTRSSGNVIIDLEDKNRFAHISILDTGVGMNAEQVQQLFKIDKRASSLGTEGEKGSGLGLVLCKEFVEKNGGEIFVESIPNHGSKFSFTIPLDSSSVS